jgi:hypothetical protein
MDRNQIRYIAILIDSKIKEHDGKVFCSIDDAMEYAMNVINENYADRAVIGMFVIDMLARESIITMIDTLGFTGDKKKINQLKLFGVK